MSVISSKFRIAAMFVICTQNVMCKKFIGPSSNLHTKFNMDNYSHCLVTVVKIKQWT
jgi:hypothetical protein